MATKYDNDFFITEGAPPPAPVASAPAVDETPNKFNSEFFITEGGDSVAPESASLTEEQIAALVGGAAGKMFGKAANVSGTGVVPRAAEAIHGAPPGSLAAVQDLAAPLSAEAVARRVAEQHVNPPQAGAPLVEERPTPGGKWAAKTGYGAGEGTVEDVNTRYKRRASSGKAMSALEKKFGVRQPGEPASLIDRMLARSAAVEEAARAATAAETQRVLAEAERVRVAQANPSTLDKIAENIRRAGGTSAMLQQALRTGLNVSAGAFGALHGFQGVSDIQKQGLTPDNAAQTIEGGALLSAMRNPTIGLPVAGTAAMYRAGKDMYNTGPSAENAAQMASGAGLVAMPRAPVVGTALQVPALSMAVMQYLRAHPELIPEWLKSQKKAAAPPSTVMGETGFGFR